MTSRNFHLHPLDPGIEPAQLLLALKHMDFWVCLRGHERHGLQGRLLMNDKD